MTKFPKNLNTVIHSARALAESSGVAALQKAIGASNLGHFSQIQNQFNISSAKSLSRVIDATRNLNINPMQDLMGVSSAKALSELMAALKVNSLSQLHKDMDFIRSNSFSRLTSQAKYLRLTQRQRLLGESSAKALINVIEPLHLVLTKQIEKQLRSNNDDVLTKLNEANSVRQNEAEYGEGESQKENKSISSFESELLSNITLNQELVESIKELGKSAASNDDFLYPEAVNDLVFGLPDSSKNNFQQPLLTYLAKLTPIAQGFLKFLIYSIFLQVLIALEVDSLKEKVKPVIDEYICKSPNATVRFVGKLILCTTDVNSERTRLVKATSLNVRATPNTKGRLLDSLPQFEPVTLISKSKDLSWSLIRYKNQDDQVVEGWVFSRYLHKPKM